MVFMYLLLFARLAVTAVWGLHMYSISSSSGNAQGFMNEC